MVSNSIPIYIEKYLTLSMTFIYRQITSVLPDTYKIILTPTQPENLNLFPYPNIYVKTKSSFELFYLKIYRKLFRRSLMTNSDKVLSLSQKKYFMNILKNEKSKFIHAHFGPSAIEIFPLAKKLNKKLLISFHGFDASMLLKSPVYIENLRKILPESYIIVPSQYMLDKITSIVTKPLKSFIIYYGIPINFFQISDRNHFIKKNNNTKIKLLQVSNFVEKKGHKYTIEAFEQVLKKFPNAELILAGDGLLKSDIERLVNELGISNNVVFKGKVNQEEVRVLMNESDIFLHHSITAESGDQEGIPNVIMEAMATGLPVISTYHAGITELINDGINGYLVTEKDILDYSKKIEIIISNYNPSIGIKARETIEQEFNLDKQIEKLNSVYLELLNLG